MSEPNQEISQVDLGEYYDPSDGNSPYIARGRVIFAAFADIQTSVASKIRNTFVPMIDSHLRDKSFHEWMDLLESEQIGTAEPLLKFLVHYRIADSWMQILVWKALFIWANYEEYEHLKLKDGIVCDWPHDIATEFSMPNNPVIWTPPSLPWHPLLQSWKLFKSQALEAITDSLEKFYRESEVHAESSGWEKTPLLRDSETEEKHFFWLATFQCGELSYDQIAEADDVATDQVKKAIQRLSSRIGLTLRGGSVEDYVNRLLSKT